MVTVGITNNVCPGSGCKLRLTCSWGNSSRRMVTQYLNKARVENHYINRGLTKYSKTCLERPLKNRQNKGLKDR